MNSELTEEEKQILAELELVASKRDRAVASGKAQEMPEHLAKKMDFEPGTGPVIHRPIKRNKNAA